MPGINMMPSGSTLQIPLDACTNFSGKAGNAQVTLTWTDPKDKYATPEGETAQDPDQLVSVWEYTQIIRKTGSQPAGPHDGELVVSSSVRDQYATTGFVDTGLVNGTLYYYAAYAYNTDGVASEGAFTSATPIAGTPLSQLAEGTLIKILENGSPVEFYLAKHSYEPSLNGTGRELLVRKDCNGTLQYSPNGNENYLSSNLDSWLNGWYKNTLSSSLQNMIGTTTFYSSSAPDAGRGNPLPASRSIFALSLTELFGQTNTWAANEGTILPISSVLKIALLDGSPVDQWTRTKYETSDGIAWCSNSEGEMDTWIVTKTEGVRACFTLPNTTLVDADLTLIES